MKTKLFLLLTAITLTFQACSSDDEDNDPIAEISPYAGTWSGTYDGDDDGTWTIEFSAKGLFVSGSSYSIAVDLTALITSAKVTADGHMNATLDNGTAIDAQVTEEDSIDGTWVNASAGNIKGTMTGSRE